MADPLAGITGSVNAGLKSNKRQPQFPKGLDQHFGLGPGITGSVRAGAPAPSPKPSFSLGGITGHALAPKATPATPKFSLRGVSGAANAGLRGPPITGSVLAKPGFTPKPRMIGGKPVSLAQSEAAVRGILKGASQPRPQAHALSSKELSKVQGQQLRTAGLGKNLIASAEPKELGKFSLGKTLENIPSSTLHTITGTPPALVKTGEAGVEALKGNLKPAKEIAKNLGQMFAHPAAALEKEPVPTALMFAGAVGGAGRLAGASMRAGTFGERAAEAASMKRAPLLIYKNDVAPDQINSGLHDVSIPRSYSPDIIHKGLQRAVESWRQRRGQDPNIASGEQANRYLYGGSLIGQHMMKRFQGTFKPGLIDQGGAGAERLRRTYERAGKQVLARIKPKVGAEAVPLAVEGILRRPDTLAEDLQKELGRLETAHGDLNFKADKRDNERNQQQIRDLQGDKKFQREPHHAFTAAKEYADEMRPIEERLVELGILEPDQLNARNIPFGLAHGHIDKLNLEPGPHPLVGEVKDLESARKAARNRFQRAIGARKATPAETKEAGVQRAVGYVKGREYRSGMLPVSKAQKAVGEAREASRALRATRQGAVDEARNDVRDLGVKLQEKKMDLQSLKDAGIIKDNGDRYKIAELNGREVHPEQLNAAVARELGDRRLGFLTHKEVNYGAALHSRIAQAPGAERFMRTGESFKGGTYRRNWDALNHQVYKNMNKMAGQESRNDMLRRFGLGRFHGDKAAKAGGRIFDETPEGERLASGLGKTVSVPLGNEKVLSRALVSPRSLGGMTNDFLPSSDRSISEVADSPTHTLMHEKVLERINQHDALNQRGPTSRLMQWYTNKWRSAALYTSPRWMLGNPQEHAIRLAFASVNPFAIFGAGRAVRVGNSLLDEWAKIASDTSRTEQVRFAARAFKADYEAGTHYGSVAMNSVRREAPEVFQGNIRDLSEAFNETRPASAMLKDWSKWKAGVGTFMDRVEKNTKAAMLGKAALKEQQKFSSGWRGLIGRQDDAIKAYAEGKLNPNEAAKLGENIMEMAGNWSTLTPFVRSAVQTWTPFGLWWLNSMKFIFKTLPRDHPLKTAALAAMVAGTGADQNEKGLVPEYLEGGIKLSLPYLGNITLTPLYYSPGGVAIEPGKTAVGMVAPQLHDTLLNLVGVNPLTYEKNKGEQFPEAASQAVANLGIGATPFARQVAQLAERGGKHEYASMNPIATKPGTQRPILKTAIKMISPLRMTLPTRAEERKGGGGLLKETLAKEALQKENLPKEKLLKY